MKKLMFAIAAVAAGTALADVTSANVVGYSNITVTERYASLGAVFKGVGTNGDAVKFKDIKVIGMDDSGTDCIQFLEGTEAAPYLYATYVDDGEGSEYTGWYPRDHVWEPENKIDEEDIPACTAFLCDLSYCSEGTPVTFVCSGEVEAGRSITATERYAFIANPIPARFPIGKVKVVGMDDTGTDCIQFLEGTEAAPYFYATYVDDGEGSEYTGWYPRDHVWEPEFKIDETFMIDPGMAFLCDLSYCNEGAPVTFFFPDPFAKDAE